ncbi:hypothetical protein Tco_0788006, partial [Tanacetum coccineum]
GQVFGEVNPPKSVLRRKQDTDASLLEYCRRSMLDDLMLPTTFPATCGILRGWDALVASLIGCGGSDVRIA